MPNRLSREASPYLLQHAENPVDWYPWGEEAFARAQQEGKPIFLSVGYATCHWCHVMARESFEDPEVARLLNAHFVPVKVDREERPDVDHAYMQALQALTGQGGWPMSLFLTPEGKPFYGGTYFPPTDRYGLPSFRRVLEAVAEAWTKRRNEIETHAAALAQRIAQALTNRPGDLPPQLHAKALEAYRQAFDPQHGGFGGAPKFPNAPALRYLLLQAWLGEAAAGEMLRVTLDRMQAGGVYDQVGGGFHRYAVDAVWRVPHFEKMLYDNAQLARVYLGAFRLFGDARYRRTARETLDYLLREMQDAAGGFYAAQDAESEGEEGRYYVWRIPELRAVLGADFEAAARYFGVSDAGNWEGKNILEARYPEPLLAQELGLDAAGFEAWLASVKARLLEARLRRVRPLTDDKILADWNGLALAAFAEAGRWLGEARYLEAARKNAEFVLGALYQDGLLRHAWRRGRLGRHAYLSDQAHYGLGLLALFEATGEMRWLEAARVLAEGILEHFRDPEGGFFDALEANPLGRPKDVFDGAWPSGNAAAAELLVRLARLYDQPEWEAVAFAAIQAQARGVAAHPLAFVGLLTAHLWGEAGGELVVVRPAPELEAWARREFWPLVTLVCGAQDALPVLERRAVGAAYLCRRGVCRLGVDTVAALRTELAAAYPRASIE
ncbi:thioredoxin domain-containing protein [Marinithermus hydrothermalis]|uniref:Thioredoxin domain-containing protein n=1 Tax=Marinithermus hydrothermalis (strain DSM 14884 / JCM 11576 / T1) TaxID=869210 RepID=F2NP41_MARHT|nr:thioredoxin domain-containing protein [Marinithermus hydrothermalis]AEB11629.1 protein of unknown function DUF255 [Marinithermus hydrothermalis DSM 14884]